MMMKKPKNTSNLPNYRVNEQIHYKGEVRITGEGIESKVIPIWKARDIANEMELDLIEIAPNAQPPVVKVDNYEKMLYAMKKNAKKNKQKTNQLKEVQLSVSIATHDLDTKASHAKKFIEEGNKVKVILTMKGRELARRDDNKRSIYEFIDKLKDVAVPEFFPKDEGNKTVVILKKKN